MQNKLSPEQQQFYGEYFNSYMNYLSKISAISSGKLTDKVLMEKFIATLVDKDPLFVYKHEPLRYKVYHFIFGITPFQIRKRIVSKFLAMPTYSKNTKNSM